ncbi:hypothetical protein Tco_0452667 [Tanacetum coccineum]
MIPEDESIDNAFAKFNTIITSLKALDEGFSSKNCVRKFLRALHPKWGAKVTAIRLRSMNTAGCILSNQMAWTWNSYARDNGPNRLLLCNWDSTRTVVIVTFGNRGIALVWSPVTISCGISSSSVLSLVWLLILVVPGGVIRTFLLLSALIAIHCHGSCGNPPIYFSTWSISSGNIRSHISASSCVSSMALQGTSSGSKWSFNSWSIPMKSGRCIHEQLSQALWHRPEVWLIIAISVASRDCQCSK